MATQRSITRDFYIQNPNRDIPHEEAVDAIEAAYKSATGSKFRDPDRAIRMLHQEGFLQKVSKGVYRYAPELVTNPDLEDFNATQKKEIMRRGNYKCAVCGRGKKDGVELHIDHIKPKDKGGRASIPNGQILCGDHNYKKKNYNQTETAKMLFVNLYRHAQSIGDEKIMKFAKDVLATYESHGVNGHIVWKEDETEN